MTQPTSGGTATMRTARLQARNADETKVNSLGDAKTWFEDNGHLDSARNDVSLGVLRNVLLFLARKTDTSVETKSGLRAAAYILEDMENKEMERMVSEAVERALEEHKGILGTLAETATATLKGLAEEVKESLGKLEEGQVVDVGRTLRGGSQPAGTGGGGRGRGGGGGLQTPAALVSYADMAQRAEHDDVMHRIGARTKQLLIDQAVGGDSTKNLTERELIEKAKVALDMMGLGGLDRPKTEFVSARKLRNGGVLYELNSNEAARWFADTAVRTSFLTNYGSGAKVTDRTYALFIEFVPVALGDDPNKGLRDIEGGNNLHPGELVHARWARAPQSRSNPSQRVAHLILDCSSNTTANRIIRNGLVIEGKRVQARKLDPEPRRCLKCQRHGKGHIAGECRQEHDTCGLCAKNHRTKECKETDPGKYCCVNCKAKGVRHDHASSARTCPTFVEAKNRLVDRSPELKYKFFPTDETWTWVRLPDVGHAGGLITGGGGGRPPRGAGTAADGQTVERQVGPPPTAPQPTATQSSSTSNLTQTKLTQYNMRWSDDVPPAQSQLSQQTQGDDDSDDYQYSPAIQALIDSLEKAKEAERKSRETTPASQ